MQCFLLNIEHINFFASHRGLLSSRTQDRLDGLGLTTFDSNLRIMWFELLTNLNSSSNSVRSAAASSLVASSNVVAVVVMVPVLGLDRVNALNIHGINLLQGSVSGLDHEEEYDHNQSRTASGKDQTVEVVDGIGDETGAEKASVPHKDTKKPVTTYKKEMRKFHSQLEAVARPMQTLRYRRG